MADLLAEEMPFIEMLMSKTATSKQKKALFESITTRQIQVIMEIFINIRNENIQLNSSQHGHLRKNIKLLIELTENNTKNTRIREIILSIQPLIIYTLNAVMPVLKKEVTKIMKRNGK